MDARNSPDDWKQEAIKHFLQVCQRTFQFLVDEYNFQTTPIPEGEFVNKFQYHFSNNSLTIIIVGEGYGTIASVSINDNHGHRIGVNNLIPGLNPFAKQKRSKKRIPQDEQIEEAAKKLKLYGQDILSGDLTRFEQIRKDIDEMWVKKNK